MQAVGQLVRLGADEARLHLVHGPVELLGAHPAQLLREEHLHPGVDGLKERAGTTDEILVKAGLALVDAHADAAGQAGILQVIPDAQLVQRMATLVEDGVHRRGHVVQVVMGGDADILVVELQREGMLGLAKAAVAAVDAHELHDVVGKGLLLLHRIFQMQEAVIDRGLLADGPDKRHDAIPQRLKEGVQLPGVHPALILVQQGVVGSLGCIVVARKFPVVIHKLLQNGAERSKIIVFLGLVPDIAGAVGQLGVGHILVRRDAGQFPALAAQQLHLALVEGIERAGRRSQFIQQALRLRVGQQLLVLSGQDAESHAPALGGILRGHRHGVQIEGVLRAGIGVEFLLQCVKAGQSFRLFHRASPFFHSSVGKAGFFQKNLRRACGSGSGISNSYRSVALMTVVQPRLHTRGSFAS